MQVFDSLISERWCREYQAVISVVPWIHISYMLFVLWVWTTVQTFMLHCLSRKKLNFYLNLWAERALIFSPLFSMFVNFICGLHYILDILLQYVNFTCAKHVLDQTAVRMTLHHMRLYYILIHPTNVYFVANLALVFVIC